MDFLVAEGSVLHVEYLRGQGAQAFQPEVDGVHLFGEFGYLEVYLSGKVQRSPPYVPD